MDHIITSALSVNTYINMSKFKEKEMTRSLKAFDEIRATSIESWAEAGIRLGFFTTALDAYDLAHAAVLKSLEQLELFEECVWLSDKITNARKNYLDSIIETGTGSWFDDNFPMIEPDVTAADKVRRRAKYAKNERIAFIKQLVDILHQLNIDGSWSADHRKMLNDLRVLS